MKAITVFDWLIDLITRKGMCSLCFGRLWIWRDVTIVASGFKYHARCLARYEEEKRSK